MITWHDLMGIGIYGVAAWVAITSMAIISRDGRRLLNETWWYGIAIACVGAFAVGGALR